MERLSHSEGVQMIAFPPSKVASNSHIGMGSLAANFRVGGWSLKSTFELFARALLAAIVVFPVASAATAADSAVGSKVVRTAGHSAATSRAGADATASSRDAETDDNQQPQPCHWWQFRRCDDRGEPEIVGLPDGAPHTGKVITVDLSTNTIYLFEDAQLVVKAPVATGSGKKLEDDDDVWLFQTPQGHMKVLSKIVNPVWKKPDWAYIEVGARVPPSNDPSRYVRGKLGKYALSLGGGIQIHGTDDPSSIGRRVSHGCIRVPDRPLERIYRSVSVGTDVYIYQSLPPQEADSTPHSDLDYRSGRANR